MTRNLQTSARAKSVSARTAPSRKTAKNRKSGLGKKSARGRKNSSLDPDLAGVRPPPGQGKRGEKGYLGYLLRQAQAAARLTLERALADIGVTAPQFAVLGMLRSHPGLSGADLARVALLTPQTTGVIIRNLERMGAIRNTSHPVHGRVLQWTLTRRGKTLLGQCRRRVLAVERRLMAGVSAKAAVTIRRFLSKIAREMPPHE